jgi:hypothetical protein
MSHSVKDAQGCSLALGAHTQELIRKSGSNTQLGVIVFLIVVLVILAVFAFS